MHSELASQIVASLPHVVAECKQMLFTSSDNVSRSKIYRARGRTTKDLFIFSRFRS